MTAPNQPNNLALSYSDGTIGVLRTNEYVNDPFSPIELNKINLGT